MIKVLYIPSLNIPVCYWRIENYAECMVGFKDRCMVNVEYFKDIIDVNMAWDDACIGKGEISEDIQRKLKNAFKFFDVIIFQRIQNMPAIVLIQELRKEYPNVKIVAELDDSVGEVPPSSPYKWADHHRWSAEHLFRSDAVICSTEYLANSIRPIVGDKKIHIAPNCINSKTWKFKSPKKETDTFRIGYVGGGAHDEDLLIAYRAILPVLEKYNHIKFIIRYGGYKPKWLKEHKQIDFKSVAWYIKEYPQRLADMNLNLALAPLRDSEFNRCKSNLKWIEWSSMNIPLLASDVEPYRKTDGFMVLTDNLVSSWTRKFEELIRTIPNIGKDYAKDDRGKKLSRQCLERYNIKKETDKLLTFLESLI